MDIESSGVYADRRELRAHIRVELRDINDDGYQSRASYLDRTRSGRGNRDRFTAIIAPAIGRDNEDY